jgi:hypothetical protein
VLFLAALLPLAGCLMEDSVSITNDGLVKVASVVSEPDEAKKIEFSQFEKGVTNLVDELRQHKWQVNVAWTSKQRPYRVTVTGSGKLADVAAATSLYDVGAIAPDKYKLGFRAPAGSRVRVAFETSKDSALILDGKGQPVQEFDTALSDRYLVIVLE